MLNLNGSKEERIANTGVLYFNHKLVAKITRFCSKIAILGKPTKYIVERFKVMTIKI